MKITSGSSLARTVSSSFRNSAALLELLRLLLFGAIAVSLHAATRNRVELGPGHQGLTWIAMLMLGRLTSQHPWAGTATAVGAAGATTLPLWRLGDPLLWLAYVIAGAAVDLGFGSVPRLRRTLWAVALLGGLAHAAKPLIRVVISQVGGVYYNSLAAGVAFPLATHFLFGAAGAAIGFALVRTARRRRAARESPREDSPAGSRGPRAD